MIENREDDLLPVPDIEAELGGDDQHDAPREIAPEEGIEELKAKLLAEQRRREEAEALASQVTGVAQHAYAEKEQSDIALVQSALQQIERDQRDLKARLAAARKTNDTDAEADVFLELQSIASNKQQLEQGLEALKERANAARQRPPQPVVPRAEDPVESVASRLTPASAKWVRAHPEFATDEGKRNKMVGAHYAAIGEGLKADSPEYFQYVEQHLGVVDEPAPRQTVQRQALRSPPPAAPARGNAPSGNTRTMQLSPQMREAARASGLTDEEYAANLAALRREGKISTN